MACDPQDLMADAEQFAGLTKNEQEVLELCLLRAIAGEDEPPSPCFACPNPVMQSTLEICLLSAWADC
jgi:hypothetical protein